MNKAKNQRKSSPNIDPKRLFISAMDYRIAGALIHAAAKKRPHIIFPAFVNFALSVELLLKCVSNLETSFTPWGHDLGELFDGCSESSQKDMEANFLRVSAKERFVYDHHVAESGHIEEPFGIRWILNQSGKTFERIRYRHEEPGDMPSFLLEAFGHAAMVQVFKFKPEWRPLRPDLSQYITLDHPGSAMNVSTLQTGFEPDK